MINDPLALRRAAGDPEPPSKSTTSRRPHRSLCRITPPPGNTSKTDDKPPLESQIALNDTTNMNDRLDRDPMITWDGDPPDAGWCYQRDDIVPGPRRFFLSCSRTEDKCKAARGQRGTTCAMTSLLGTGFRGGQRDS